MLDTPAHEGDERGRAKVHGGRGGDFQKVRPCDWADDPKDNTYQLRAAANAMALVLHVFTLS